MKPIVIFLCTAAVAWWSSPAWAGENACGALLTACGSVTKTTPATCLGIGEPQSCFDLDPGVATQLAPGRSWVAVYVGRYPPLTSLAGVDFGVDYDPAALRSPIWAHCGSLEVNGAGWPAPGTGNTVVWTAPQSGETVLVGYFTVLRYSGYAESAYEFTLGAHPAFGTARVMDGAAQFDVLRYPAVANLAGGWGDNVWCSCADPVEPTSWGRVKALYGD